MWKYATNSKVVNDINHFRPRFAYIDHDLPRATTIGLKLTTVSFGLVLLLGQSLKLLGSLEYETALEPPQPHKNIKHRD